MQARRGISEISSFLRPPHGLRRAVRNLQFPKNRNILLVAVTTQEILFHPFTLGFALGLVFTVLALYQFFRAKGELKRFRRHLSDKLEIEAETAQKNRAELDKLRKENEHLRVKVAGFNDLPEHRARRDLEIFGRAEKRMLISVPGFAPAWESAKAEALAEIEGEESGRSLPKRMFARLFPNTAGALPHRDEAGVQHPQQRDIVRSGSEMRSTAASEG